VAYGSLDENSGKCCVRIKEALIVLLNGKVSLVTGGASGIGRQVALTFAKEGSKVAIVDIKEDEGEVVQEELCGLTAGKFIKCDVTQISNIEKAVQEVKQCFGKIDVLANCAGLANRTPIENVTEAEWDLLNSVNLKAGFFVSREVVKIMRENKGGRIVNISSLRAHVSDDRHTIYDVTKGGVEAMTRSFAIAFAKDNISVNAVAPGYVLTPMTRHNLSREGWLDALKSRVPMGRMVEMQEVANAVLFMASDLSTAITGQVLIIDGGRQVHE
jgi:2-deoxy-D-gluconate 3-dehydrogenase